jgi:hypothetical protein
MHSSGVLRPQEERTLVPTRRRSLRREKARVTLHLLNMEQRAVLWHGNNNQGIPKTLSR